ncbi:MAG: hypothetical protein K8H74_18065 [Notoacmeibacter sp.]|nr:hypothetical protein [Notoacmeibacter sp.]
MTNDLPFLSLAQALERTSSPLQSENPDRRPSHGPGSPSHDWPADRVIEAALKAVQSGFPHLSITDIAHPPRQWLDAALARQIAIHILVHQFGFSRNRLARELGRARASTFRALEVVDERMISPEFEDSYATMAARARDALKEHD